MSCTSLGKTPVLPKGAKLFPMPKNAYYISADKITNKTWLNGLRSLTTEAVADKLFGSMTVDEVMRDMFQDLKGGSCKGYQQAMFFDRQKMSIEKAFRKNTQHKERPCLIQVCYNVKKDLQGATAVFKEVCKNFKKVCNNKRELKKLPSAERHIYAAAIAFWKKHHIHHCSDPKFANKLQGMIRKYKKINVHSPGERTYRHTTVDTVEKCQKAKALLKKFCLLREKILGGKPAKPTKKIESVHQRKLEKKVFSWSKKYNIAEINYYPQGHVFQVYRPPGKFNYVFDIGCGLIRRKKPEKEPNKAPHLPHPKQIYSARIFGKKK